MRSFTVGANGSTTSITCIDIKTGKTV
jgi:hypothetical protein